MDDHGPSSNSAKVGYFYNAPKKNSRPAKFEKKCVFKTLTLFCDLNKIIEKAQGLNNFMRLTTMGQASIRSKWTILRTHPKKTAGPQSLKIIFFPKLWPCVFPALIDSWSNSTYQMKEGRYEILKTVMRYI